MRRYCGLIVLLVLMSFSGLSQSFEKFLIYVENLPLEERQAKVDSFMTANDVFPLIEADTSVTYIYQGVADSIFIAGDVSGWNPNLKMKDIGGTDLWYYPGIYESDARLDYKIVLNGISWILDPLNPNTIMSGFGPNSELAMPDYEQPKEIAYYPDIPHGNIYDTTYYSEELGNSRLVRIYTPPGYEGTSVRYPTIYFHDGLEYLTLAHANNVIDYLIEEELIRPIIAVFIPPVNRTEEYAQSHQDEFTSFVVNTIVPSVDSNFRTIDDPEHRAMLGPSYGGNISLWIGLTNIEVFGKLAAQSSYIQSDIFDTIQAASKKDIKIYLDMGTYDIPTLIPMVRNFVTILNSTGNDYVYNEYHEGHSWGMWRAHIDNALRFFFPPSSSINESGKIHSPLKLEQNIPNPFDQYTQIHFEAPEGEHVRLELFDFSGRRIRTIWEGRMSAAKNSLMFHKRDLRPGVYLYTLSMANASISRKMMID